MTASIPAGHAHTESRPRARIPDSACVQDPCRTTATDSTRPGEDGELPKPGAPEFLAIRDGATIEDIDREDGHPNDLIHAKTDITIFR